MNIGSSLGVIVLNEVEGAPDQLQFLISLGWIVDIVVVLGLIFFFRSLHRKYKEVNQYLWEEEPSGEGRSSWTPLLLSSGISTCLLLLLPKLMGLSWKEMAHWQPYLVYLLLLMLLVSFFSGIFLAYVRFSHRQKLQYKEKATAD